MAEFVSVRDLKNKAPRLLREVEEGKKLIVTRHGKPIATLRPFEVADLRPERLRYATTMYDVLRRQIETRYPTLKNRRLEQRRRHFEKVTEKIGQALPFKTWQEMDKAASRRCSSDPRIRPRHGEGYANL